VAVTFQSGTPGLPLTYNPFSITLWPLGTTATNTKFVTPVVSGFLTDPQVGDTFPIVITLIFPPFLGPITYDIRQYPQLMSFTPSTITFAAGQTVANSVVTVNSVGIASVVLIYTGVTPGFASIVLDNPNPSSKNNLGLITFTNMPISLYQGESYWVRVNRNYFYADVADTLNFGFSGGSSKIDFTPAVFNAGDQYTYITVNGTAVGTIGFITLSSSKYTVETRHINVGKFLTILNNVKPNDNPQEVFLYCPTDESISFNIFVSDGLKTDYTMTTVSFSRALPIVGIPVWGQCGTLTAITQDTVPRVSYGPAAYEGAFKFKICA